ncbi:MAG: Beta-N-acetylhexosaminidase [Sphingobacteriaceae bacterium]|jgi:hexosaminidase|nr:Beta-N-acetylhexosaminidase [Sphingobacteriaceae bacterium]
MKYILAVALLFSSVLVKSQVSILPEPVKIVNHTGYFTLPSQVLIQAPAQEDVKPIVEMLEHRLHAATGYSVRAVGHSSPATIKFVLNSNADVEIGDEGYHLESSSKGIQITANKPAGLFYGMQTLLQLLPNEIESKVAVYDVKWHVPLVSITDYPRFAWRGLMFDVARHFFSVADVKSYIDEMVRYKLNVFHWHLTDDEGWRIEIKSLPNLTVKGAYNVARVGKFGSYSPILPNEPRTQGGFYTQEQIKEVVQYAKERFVNVLPEVDVPGHSLAAVSSYPEISCTADAVNYEPRSGAAGFMAWTSNGIIASVDNTICPANEKAYEFLDKVFGEIAPLFPFEYIHIGGDECAKNFWEKSDAVKALMVQQNLKNMDEVQSYFEHRVTAIVASKGKKVIGWDEILEGGLAPGAAVMSWRGEKGGLEAAKQQHEVVMSPNNFMYLDFVQGEPSYEPPVYSNLRLEKSYQFDPLPAGMDPRFVKGGQANLWTEQIYNMRHAQYMLWPRAFALAESVWSPKEKKNWNNFVGKVEDEFKRLDVREVNYSPAMYDPIVAATKDTTGVLTVNMRTEVEGLDIYYSFDNSFPDKFYPKYTSPVKVPIDAIQMRVITYRGGKPIGRMLSIPTKDLQNRAAAKK